MYVSSNKYFCLFPRGGRAKGGGVLLPHRPVQSREKMPHFWISLIYFSSLSRNFNCFNVVRTRNFIWKYDTSWFAAKKLALLNKGLPSFSGTFHCAKCLPSINFPPYFFREEVTLTNSPRKWISSLSFHLVFWHWVREKGEMEEEDL